MDFMRAYATAAIAINSQAMSTTVRNRVRSSGIIAIVTLSFSMFLHAAEPPANLAKRVAHRESETAAERSQYAYTQSVKLNEMPGGKASLGGEYRELREVVFSPSGDRTDRIIGEPVNNLKNLILTEEDFDDFRNIQPFVMTEDQLWNYESKYKGEERIEGVDCWVLSVKPRQILSGQRLFEGLLWINQADFSVVRSEGQAVPQIRTGKQENLFLRFTTVRRRVNGFWFPAMTYADDTLHFRTGPIREKLIIRYNDYKKFGSETKIVFEDPK